MNQQEEAIARIYEALRIDHVTKSDAINLLTEAGIARKTAKNTVEIWERGNNARREA